MRTTRRKLLSLLGLAPLAAACGVKIDVNGQPVPLVENRPDVEDPALEGPGEVAYGNFYSVRARPTYYRGSTRAFRMQVTTGSPRTGNQRFHTVDICPESLPHLEMEYLLGLAEWEATRVLKLPFENLMGSKDLWPGWARARL